MIRLTMSLAVFAALLLMLTPDATAGKAGKCRSSCAKCCKVVCETKLVKKTVWVVECEEFCVANPTLGGGKCTQPRCGKSRSRKQLIKKEILVEVPAYRCVPAKCVCDSK
ncbi:MAG: hypothetical protein HQ567_26200 [Candidatus Nealsonbacteria bacterium]|nr:hypothetical protein [Candidatus Nealsonbacteria bacterium]